MLSPKEYTTIFAPDLQPILKDKLFDLIPYLSQRENLLAVREQALVNAGGTNFQVLVLRSRYSPQIAKLKAEIARLERYFRLLQFVKNPKTNSIPARAEALRAQPLESFLGKPKSRNKTKSYYSCPFHKDNHPSFVVYVANNWYCYSCHQGGDTIEFLKLRDNLSFKKVIEVYG